MEDRIKEEISNFCKNPKNIVYPNQKEILLDVYKISNFNLAFKKFKKDPTLDKFNEFLVAKRLNGVGFHPIFFAEKDFGNPTKQGSYMIFRKKSLNGKPFSEEKTPDLLVFSHGKFFHCEIKSIQEYFREHSAIRDLSNIIEVNKWKMLMSKKILQRVRESIEQIRPWGFGMVYVLSHNALIDFEYLTTELNKIFKDNGKLLSSVVIEYMGIKKQERNGNCTSTTMSKSIKVFTSPYFKIDKV